MALFSLADDETRCLEISLVGSTLQHFPVVFVHFPDRRVSCLTFQSALLLIYRIKLVSVANYFVAAFTARVFDVEGVYLHGAAFALVHSSASHLAD